MQLKLHCVDNFPLGLFHLVVVYKYVYKYLFSKTKLQAPLAQGIFGDIYLESLTKPRTKNDLIYLFITLDSKISMIYQYFQLLPTWLNKCDFKSRSDSCVLSIGRLCFFIVGTRKPESHSLLLMSFEISSSELSH